MSTDLAPTNAPPAPKPQLRSGGSLAAIVPQSIEEAFRMASAVVASGMAPKTYDTPEKAMVAILHGMEVGLTPMAALQSIAVVNGMPTIWGDGALALVRASGLCEWIREWTEGDVAYCEVKRRGDPAPVVRSFSDADARAAGLLDKAGPWKQYRPRMRQMRARSYALRDVFADVLRGLRIAEEVQDYQPMRDVTPSSGGTDSSLRALLKAKPDRAAAPAEGFSSAHVQAETAPAETIDADTGEILPDAGQTLDDAGSTPAGDQSTPVDGDLIPPGPTEPAHVLVRLKAALAKAWADGSVEKPADVDAVSKPFADEINKLGVRKEARAICAEFVEQARRAMRADRGEGE